MPTYNPKTIEPKWQRYWEKHKTFHIQRRSGAKKYYILDMFPYPSGTGLHVGHPEGYTATDILARYRRMRGDDVLHPMGWDAFGLPAEQYALATGTHPRVTTERNVSNFRRQIKMLGFSYDWDREVNTTDPAYVKWTQWIFLLLFDTWYDPQLCRGRPIAELPIPAQVLARGADEVRRYQDSRRLAYQAEVPVNWCAELGTVLANEEVVLGRSERGGHPVERIPLRQWLLRITAYADRLLEDLRLVEWPEAIKKMQHDWIGRSEGAEVDFAVASPASEPAHALRVFTTRPDTLFGATYLVLSPEHALVDTLTAPTHRADVDEYRRQASTKSELERTDLAKTKTGVFTGGHAVNPVNQERLPVWIADYVLASYGTGAIMAVPAHDERDWEFALGHGLSVRAVVLPPRPWLAASPVFEVVQSMPGRKTGSEYEKADAVRELAESLWQRHSGDPMQITEQIYRRDATLFPEAYTGAGVSIHSGPFDGQETAVFQRKIVTWLHEHGAGLGKTNYKLRDWLFSRQRYWGEPFPILHEVDARGRPTGLTRPLSLTELPLTLPELEDYQPTGKPEPPLEKATDWVWLERDGQRYKRETNTMPQWAGSCWYYLRYLDPRNERSFCSPEEEQAWMPVDLYVGGAEHAVLHLLYSRFWHKVLFDRGFVHTPEPFHRLVNQGMILGEMEFTALRQGDRWISADQTPESGQAMQVVRVDEEEVEKRGDGFVLKADPAVRVDARAYKMSKSRGNVINPDEVVERYGADSMRLYEMFMGPLEATKPWSMRGVEGVYRFLGRVWRLVVDDRAESLRLAEAVRDQALDRDTLRLLHRTIQKVTEDLEGMRFNTAIAAMMEYSNHLTRLTIRPRAALEPLVLLLAPFAPHFAEELWSAFGHGPTLAYQPWPEFDEAQTRAEQIEVPVQINGKVRTRLTLPADAGEEVLRETALADPRIRELMSDRQLARVIVVPRKLVNIVLR